MKILLVVLSLTLVACGNEDKAHGLSDESLISMKAILIEESLGLEKMDTLQKAIELRDLAHHKIALAYNNVDWNSYNPVDNLEQSLKGELSYGHYCGGISYTYQDMLAAFGIKSRNIQLIASAGGIDTHVSTEVFINGRWIVMDPTFNLSFRINGAHVGYAELQTVDWGAVEFFTDNKNPLPGRAAQDYYLPYKDLMHEIWFFNEYPDYKREISYKSYK